MMASVGSMIVGSSRSSKARVARTAENSSFYSLALSFGAEPFTHKCAFHLFKVLGEKGGELVERNKFHPIVKIHVPGVGHDDQFLGLTG
jgi:hypothetical protein